MSAVDDAIAQIDAETAVRAPQYEGLKDYALLNILPDTKKAVQDMLVRYDTRMGLLSTNRDFLVKLRDDPALDIQQVSAAVYADLRDQELTIAAALAQFVSADPASKLGLAAQAPERK